MVEILSRQWGEEIIFAFTDIHCGKVLKRKAGTKGGFQCHVKEEHHYLLSGRLLLRTKVGVDIIERIVIDGAAWTVPPLSVHQEEALTDCVIIEVSDPTQEDRFAIEPDPGGLPSMSDAHAIQELTQLKAAARRKAAQCDFVIGMIQTDGLRQIVGVR